MAKKNIVEMLVKTLDRENIELLTLCVTFLKKLSIRGCNKDEMDRLNCIAKLSKLLNYQDAELVHVTLKLLFNLTFDKKIRAKMLHQNIVPQLVNLLRDDKHQNIVLKLLYQFSRDRRTRSGFTYTECVHLVTDMVILSRNSTVDIELIALCINLSKDEENVEQLVDKNLVPDLLWRALLHKDPLLMKMLRNISKHSFAKDSFLDYVEKIAACIEEQYFSNIDFAIESIGILGNLNLPDINYEQIFVKYNLIPFIKNVLKTAEDDIILDIIVMLGTAIQVDIKCAELVCCQDLLTQIVDLLNAKQVDDEIVLQIVYVFYQILAYEQWRPFLIKETDAVAYLIDLMRDKNKIVRKWCNYCLDLIALSDQEWASRIKVEKFRAHNSEWLDMVENHDVDAMDFEEPDDDLPPFIDADFMNNVELGPTGQRIALDLDIFNTDNKDESGEDNKSPNNDEKKEFIPYATVDTSV
ncbi:kinesin-associated protein 3-like [Chrysoperla carnea]|nr:kinesin-associated protein 3-like [Chrysoperla carnea]